MDVRNIFVLLISLICLSTGSETDFFDGSGSGGSGDDTTVSTTSATTTEGPPHEEERVTMILYNVTTPNDTVADLKVSVAKYVELYCADNGEACVPSALLVQTIESIAYGQATEEDMTLFRSMESRLLDRRRAQGVAESHQYRVMQDNVTVDSDGVTITSYSMDEDDNLQLEYFVLAFYSNRPIIVPQVAVEATLDKYEVNITEEIGVTFDYIPDPPPDGGVDGGDDDDDDLEAWAISLIAVGGVAVLGGAGYFIYKQQSSKKRKRKSAAYLDDYAKVNTNSSNSNLYTSTSQQRNSYGSQSESAPSYKYDNPTYDKTDEDEKPDKDGYQEVDLEAGSSDELRTSL